MKIVTPFSFFAKWDNGEFIARQSVVHPSIAREIHTVYNKLPGVCQLDGYFSFQAQFSFVPASEWAHPVVPKEVPFIQAMPQIDAWLKGEQRLKFEAGVYDDLEGEFGCRLFEMRRGSTVHRSKRTGQNESSACIPGYMIMNTLITYERIAREGQTEHISYGRMDTCA